MALVSLVSMPFAAVERPSIGLSLLASALRGAGIETGVTYANIDFAEQAGLDRISLISRLRDDRLVGEWVFSRAAFPAFTGDDARYFANIDFSLADALAGSHAQALEALEQVRTLAAPFVDSIAQRLVAQRPRVVGATSMFQQRCASLALLRRVHELDPSIITMLGGANCEGAMGKAHFESFPWLDYVVSGEADLVIVDLISDILRWGRATAASRLPAGVHGPAHRRGASGTEPPLSVAMRPPVTALDELPIPAYHDYFERLAQSPIAERVRPGLLIETSRGCWWGARQHCTFCGLNGNGMRFREKSPARVLHEMKELTERHGVFNLELVDNILAMSYFDTLLPQLAAAEPPYLLFAETKANLKRQHVERLAAAGVRWIQPGIENLHDDVLRLMRKGSTAFVNVQLMKWAREIGVHLTWFYLFGFPGEQPEWYAEVAGWLPLISHLQPPGGMLPVRFDRFSPYHSQPQEHGLKLEPNRSHSHVFPLAPAVLEDFAYFFESADRMREGAAPDWPPAACGEAYGALQEAITRWHERFWLSLPDILSMRDDGVTLSLLDTRAVATARRHSLQGLHRAVHLACDQPQTVRSCAAAVQADAATVGAAICELEAHRLLLRQGERVLALAVRGDLPALPRRDQFPGGSIRSATMQGGFSPAARSRHLEPEKVGTPL